MNSSPLTTYNETEAAQQQQQQQQQQQPLEVGFPWNNSLVHGVGLIPGYKRTSSLSWESIQHKKIRTNGFNVQKHLERTPKENVEGVSHQCPGSSIHHSFVSNNDPETKVSTTLGLGPARLPFPDRSSINTNKMTRSTERKKLLFEKILSSSDVGGYNRLVIPRKFAEAHFPCLKTGEDQYKKETLYFYDKNNKLWDINLEFWGTSQSYALTRGWKKFVKEHKLHIDDVIRVYEHNFQEEQQEAQEMQEGERKYYGIDHCRSLSTKVIRLFGKNIIVRDNCSKSTVGVSKRCRPYGAANAGHITSNGGRQRIRRVKAPNLGQINGKSLSE